MQLLTPRLILREYVPTDLDTLLAHHADPRAREFYGPDEASPSSVRELLRAFMTWASEEPRRNWQLAITRRGALDQAIGSCGLRQTGLEHGRADLGVELAPDSWGHGYGIEALTALIDFGFRELALLSIRGETVSANTRVARLVERVGFRFNGSREGPDWMIGRGWTYAEWELERDSWNGARIST